jgi:hypothetical protein
VLLQRIGKFSLTASHFISTFALADSLIKELMLPNKTAHADLVDPN